MACAISHCIYCTYSFPFCNVMEDKKDKKDNFY